MTMTANPPPDDSLHSAFLAVALQATTIVVTTILASAYFGDVSLGDNALDVFLAGVLYGVLKPLAVRHPADAKRPHLAYRARLVRTCTLAALCGCAVALF